MSDIFGDDFTEELRKYFLSALSADVDKFIDLLDESTWKKVKTEIEEAIPNWIVDAKTNEFIYIAEWMGRLSEYVIASTSYDAIVSYLEVAKKYVENLLHTLKDSPEFPMLYTLNREMQGLSFYLHCKIFDQEVVIPIRNVVEVIPNLPVYAIPEAREGLLGVISFRGDAIPVFNWWDYGFIEKKANEYMYVICEQDGIRFSLQVTEADDLVKVSDKDFQVVEENRMLANVPFINKYILIENRSVMVLDIEKLVAV